MEVRAEDPGPEATAAAEAEIEIPVFTLVLPSWTADPQKVQLIQPAEDDLSHFDLESHEESHSTSTNPPPENFSPEDIAVAMPQTKRQPESVSGTVAAVSPESDSPTSAHLLMPQLAPPMADPVEFPKWTPASDIWINGFAAIVEGERHQEAGDLVAAIASFQTARGAYEMVEARFPEWQAEIIDYRLGDLERRIRLLVQKTATAESK